jgi:acetylornithine deacetylase
MPDRLPPRAILERLVAFPTVSCDSNLPLIDWVEGYLSGHGIACGRVWNAERTKAGLYAHVGPQEPGGVLLSGHTDVVPVDGQAWTVDPWRVTERDGRLHGRGTADMKGFVALALDALVAAAGRPLARPLQIALSFDEEVGCTGAPPLIAALKAALPPAAAVLVGEPTGLKVVTAHKGGMGFATHVRGVEVHSAQMHRGVSAIHEAAEIIAWGNRVNEANRAAAPGLLAAAFDPPFTTLHVGRIEGGTAHNITAGHCRFLFDFRVVPGERMEDWRDRYLALLAERAAAMRAVHREAGISAEPYFWLPPLSPEAGGAAEALARRLTGDNGRHVVSFGTEAGHFQAAGFSAVVVGPGDIARAHQADEFITLDEFAAGEAFLSRLVGSLAA